MAFIEPCFGIGHNLSLICQMTSEDTKHQLIIINNQIASKSLIDSFTVMTTPRLQNRVCNVHFVATTLEGKKGAGWGWRGGGDEKAVLER